MASPVVLDLSTLAPCAAPTAPARPRVSRLRATCASLLLTLCALAAHLGVAQAGALEEGEKALAERRFADAAERFAVLLEKEPAHRAATLGLARAAVEGRLATEVLENAEGHLTKLVKQPEGQAQARVALAEVYLTLAPRREDPKSKEFTFRDAQLQFERALEAEPGHPAATVGVAKVFYNLGEFDKAAGLLDGLLESKPTAPAHYWRGMLYYEHARAAYQEAPQAERTRALFKKAKDSFEVSSRLDGTCYDTWMQLAYAAQYVGEVDTAYAGYAKALGLDAESPYPLRGLKALKAGDDAGYVAALTTLAGQAASNVAVWYALGEAHMAAGRYEPAAKAFETFRSRARDPRQVHLLLGRAYAGLGREADAIKSFEQALAVRPDDVYAADELDQRLRAKHGRAAAASVEAARSCEEDFERLAKMAPGNPFVLNNGAFILREAYGPHQGHSAWRPVLEASTRMYEAATKIVDDTPYEAVDAAPWGTRYAWAQITSDTGLMFQFYESTFDAVKAETYYLRALKLTETGYVDAWTNLYKLYRELGQHQKAYDLAEKAAQGLRNEAGEPHLTARKQAEAEMARLLREGKAKAN